jgi:hypothetical protein
VNPSSVEIPILHFDITLVALLVAVIGVSLLVIVDTAGIRDVSTLARYYLWPFFLRMLVVAVDLKFAIKQAA